MFHARRMWELPRHQAGGSQWTYRRGVPHRVERRASDAPEDWSVTREASRRAFIYWVPCHRLVLNLVGEARSRASTAFTQGSLWHGFDQADQTRAIMRLERRAWRIELLAHRGCRKPLWRILGTKGASSTPGRRQQGLPGRVTAPPGGASMMVQTDGEERVETDVPYLRVAVAGLLHRRCDTC